MTIDTVVRGVQLTLEEPGSVTVLESAVLDSLEGCRPREEVGSQLEDTRADESVSHPWERDNRGMRGPSGSLGRGKKILCFFFPTAVHIIKQSL